MTVKKTDNKQKDGRHKLTEAGPGRPKGSTNKFTDLKQAYLDIFEKIEKEGKKKDSIIKSFFKWATKNDRNQGMFYQMLSKLLPSNIGVEHSGKIDHAVFMMPRPKKKKEDAD